MWEVLTRFQGDQLVTQVRQWEQTVLVGLVLAAVALVLVEDWRAALLAWAGASVAVALLLLALLPVPWALSRAVAAGLDGSILWLGARRWPVRRWPWPGPGLLVRATLVVVSALVLRQGWPYVQVPQLDWTRNLALVVLVMTGLLTQALDGGTIKTALGLLLWINAAILLLGALRLPPDWLYALTLLDAMVALAGGHVLIGEGLWAYHRLTERE